MILILIGVETSLMNTRSPSKAIMQIVAFYSTTTTKFVLVEWIARGQMTT